MRFALVAVGPSADVGMPAGIWVDLDVKQSGLIFCYPGEVVECDVRVIIVFPRRLVASG